MACLYSSMAPSVIRVAFQHVGVRPVNVHDVRAEAGRLGSHVQRSGPIRLVRQHLGPEGERERVFGIPD